MKKKREADHQDSDLESSGETESNDNVLESDSVFESDSEIPQPDAEMVKLREENQLSSRQLERAKADLANIRKRHRKELDQARGHAMEGFATELLPVLDSFHLALGAHQNAESQEPIEDRSMLDGLNMVRSLLEGALERHGLVEILAQDADFDPNLHEAIGLDPSSDMPPGKVTQVVQRGYMMGGKVLRASRVLVSGEMQDTEGSPDQDAKPPESPSAEE